MLFAKDWKNSLVSSTSNSPTLDEGSSTLKTKKGLLHKSITDHHRVSSKGIELNPYLLIDFLSPKASSKAWPKVIPTSSTVW